MPQTDKNIKEDGRYEPNAPVIEQQTDKTPLMRCISLQDITCRKTDRNRYKQRSTGTSQRYQGLGFRSGAQEDPANEAGVRKRGGQLIGTSCPPRLNALPVSFRRDGQLFIQRTTDRQNKDSATTSCRCPRTLLPRTDRPYTDSP